MTPMLTLSPRSSIAVVLLALGCSSSEGSSSAPSAGNGSSGSNASAGGTSVGGTASSSSSGGLGGSVAASAGGVSAGGTSSSAGASGSTSASGSTGASGATGVSGSPGAAGAGGAGTTASCGGAPAPNPFGCSFAWGVNSPGGTLSKYNYLQYMSNWAGFNIQANGTFSSFDASSWLKSISSTTLIPAYYAYLIGYYGHVNGLPDGNQAPQGPSLTTGMGALLLGVDNAACPQGPPATICADNLLVKAYAWYATQTYAIYKKPIVWLLEGDFIQYSPEGSQTVPLSYAQLGQLAAQITVAIKCNDPAAVVAFNYSTWISTAQMNSYFGAINTAMTALGTSYDMVWTSGKGSSASPGTATYAALHTLTGKPILVDESFGLSAANDTWANQSAATINARIGEGVVAANITTDLPSYLQTNVTSTLAPSALGTTCP